MQRAIENLSGLCIGKYRVREDSPDRFVLSGNRIVAWLGVWAVLVTSGLFFLAAEAAFFGNHGKKTIGIWAIIIGVICFLQVLANFATYTVDGSAKSVTRRNIFRATTWPRERFSAVSLSVAHHNANEILVLALDLGDNKEIVASVSSTSKGTSIVAIAIRMANLLEIPFHRFGQAVQGGAELCEALAQTNTPAGDGDGRDLIINCPACRKKNTPAVAFDLTEKLHGFAHTSSWVRCLSCKADLHSKLRADELRGMSAEMLAVHVRHRLPWIKTTTALFAAILCLFPWVGIIISPIAMIVNWRVRAWTRTLSIIALAISTIVTVIGLIIISN